MSTKLFQVHWQYFDSDKTDFVSQREIRGINGMKDWIAELWLHHPPPEGACFLMVDDESDLFIRTKEN